MKIIEAHPFISAMVVGIILIVAFALCWVYISRDLKKARKESKEGMIKIVEDILESVGWPSKERWISDTEKEFVSIILGLIPDQHKIWARVKITKTSIVVVVEYWYTIDHIEHEFGKRITRIFNERGVTATMQSANRQPRPEEIYIPTPPVKNEWDDPTPPFGPKND